MLNQSLADYMNAMTGHIYLSIHLPPHPTDFYNLIDVFGHGIEPAAVRGPLLPGGLAAGILQSQEPGRFAVIQGLVYDQMKHQIGALAKTTNLVYEDLLDFYARHDRPSNNATPGCACWSPWTAFAAGKTAQGPVDLVLWPAGRRVMDKNGRICGAKSDATIHWRAVWAQLAELACAGVAQQGGPLERLKCDSVNNRFRDEYAFHGNALFTERIDKYILDAPYFHNTMSPDNGLEDRFLP
ncbi:hypothetical protein KL938_003265 [Ogataea parapolymorpha]|nr:hypothetical protein KL938_003265 [Ogataea parapolymorpha]